MGRVLIALHIFVAATASVGAQETSSIEVDAGRSVVVEDAISGYDYLDFTVDTAAGDVLAVILAATDLSTYFNVMSPNVDEAIFNGSIEGDSFAGTVDTAGLQTIRVYMMRNAARRGETSRFALAIGRPGTGGVDGMDALVAGSPFHATAQIDCGATGERRCPAGVVRGAAGKTAIFVTNPDTGIRHWIDLDQGTIDGPAARTRQEGDTLHVTLGDAEYRIPQAFVTGD
ncbi:hypothetical protein [Aliihoeflea sp. 40Bstr573]|uniref:hypothetical protein n=1 Tax=Aliihoeflea sp. 40Bstr573 TaxID=2696467 RepID=UPI002095EC9F|nr:hypothetical protein [Aliihoeflea sp. 40Bstr573]MCO6386783.1 hypothetical protein [Aliihoeflea sp. 40Bstr573]